MKPTVYFGSYNGMFYALDARSGKVRWTHRDGGRISGGATVVGDIVYFSNYGKKDTTGLGARTGREVFHMGRGAFNPVISDGRTIFLTGYSTPLRAQARIAKPGGAERLLDLGDAVRAVVEDRGGQDGVRAGLQALDEVLRLADPAGGDDRHLDRGADRPRERRARSRPGCRRGPCS